MSTYMNPEDQCHDPDPLEGQWRISTLLLSGWWMIVGRTLIQYQSNVLDSDPVANAPDGTDASGSL